MKPRRRTILKVFALLITGATLNVAVAWGLMMVVLPTWGQTDGIQRKYYVLDVDAADIFEESFPGPSNAVGSLWASRISMFGWTHTSVDRQTDAPLESEDADEFMLLSVEAIDAGWPVRCLAGRSVWDSRCDFHRTLHGAWMIPDWVAAPKNRWRSEFVPLRPLWPGFAVNTLFYAGVLWVLFCGPFALRRMIRRRRGQCPACNYPIGQSPVCTECGAAANVTVARV